MAITLAMLSACGMSLQGHALTAVSASHVLKTFSVVVDQEMNDDFKTAGVLSEPEREKRAEAWDRKLEVLHGARDLLQQYASLIALANDNHADPKEALAPIARRVVAAWTDVLSIADMLGVPLPQLPEKLVRYAEGSAR